MVLSKLRAILRTPFRFKINFVKHRKIWSEKINPGRQWWKENLDFEKKKQGLEQAQAKLLEKQLKEEERLNEFIRKWRGTTRKKVAQVRDREKKLTRLKEEMVEAPADQSKMHLTFSIKVEPVKKVLEVVNLSKSYGEHRVLSDVNLTLYRG